MNLEPSHYPLVSIVAICYNHAKYLVETLDSIRYQTYPNIQLIIMDDCSSDNSVDIIKNWIEKTKYPCVFVIHPENKGLCKTINEALTLCNGVYYQAIACDDILLEYKIEKQVAILENNASIPLVCSNFQEIDEQGNIITNKYFSDEFKFPQDPTMAILTGSRITIHSPTVLLRKDVFKEVGNYREDILQEDFDMWLKISAKYKIEYLHDVTVKYRVLPDSLSRDKNKINRLRLDHLKVLKNIYSIHPKYRKDIDDVQLHVLMFFKKLALKKLYSIEEVVILFFEYSSESLKENSDFRYYAEELLFELLLINKEKSLSLLTKYEFKITRKKYKLFFIPWVPNIIPNYLLKIKRRLALLENIQRFQQWLTILRSS